MYSAVNDVTFSRLPECSREAAKDGPVKKKSISLNLYFRFFLNPDKSNFDVAELLNLSPNETFSNVGSLIMKNGWRPLIVYGLS